MIPVTQTKMVVRNQAGEMVVRGNCYAAVIASLLELPITEVPNVEVLFSIEGPDKWLWDEVMNKWLKHKGYRRDYAWQYMAFHSDIFARELAEGNVAWDRDKFCEEHKDVIYMTSGLSERGMDHVCLYRAGQMIFDPHPSRDGLLEVKHFHELVKIEV